MAQQKNPHTPNSLTFIRQVITNETKNDGVELDKLKFSVRVCLHTKQRFLRKKRQSIAHATYKKEKVMI